MKNTKRLAVVFCAILVLDGILVLVIYRASNITDTIRYQCALPLLILANAAIGGLVFRRCMVKHRGNKAETTIPAGAVVIPAWSVFMAMAFIGVARMLHFYTNATGALSTLMIVLGLGTFILWYVVVALLNRKT